MSRITGNDAKGLMEAYGAVYQPKQLTEEQVWEGVEKWVNALVEEGYDLSDYTWEEAYEAYFQLDEVAPLAIPAAMAAAPYVLPALGAATYAAKEFMNRRKTKSQEPVDYGQTSFAASKEAERRGKEAAELNRKQNQPTQPTSTPVSGRTIRGERPRIRVAATRPQGSTTSTPGASAQQPKPEAPKPEAPKPEAPKPEAPKPEAPKPEAPIQSSTSSTGNTGSATGGSGGRKPKPEGPNWAQRQLTDIQRGRAQEKGAGTAERLGRVIGSGEKITKGSAEWAAKNLLAKPLGALAGAGLVGTAGYGAYKGSEALIKQFGPGIMKWGKSVLTPNLQNNSYDMNRDEVIIECLNLIANHLIEGKYASNEKGALKIMENMSDGWALNILGNYLEE
jgi:hypothetical protein